MSVTCLVPGGGSLASGQAGAETGICKLRLCPAQSHAPWTILEHTGHLSPRWTPEHSKCHRSECPGPEGPLETNVCSCGHPAVTLDSRQWNHPRQTETAPPPKQTSTFPSWTPGQRFQLLQGDPAAAWLSPGVGSLSNTTRSGRTRLFTAGYREGALLACGTPSFPEPSRASRVTLGTASVLSHDDSVTPEGKLKSAQVNPIPETGHLLDDLHPCPGRISPQKSVSWEGAPTCLLHAPQQRGSG